MTHNILSYIPYLLIILSLRIDLIFNQDVICSIENCQTCDLQYNDQCSMCNDGYVLVTPYICSLCGNGVVDVSENCDTGTNPNLGCLNCQINTAAGWNCYQAFNDPFADPTIPSTASICVQCGDGILQPLAGEKCDDGNQVNNDGCDFIQVNADTSVSLCQFTDTTKWSCQISSTSSTICIPICGDGIRLHGTISDYDEPCDDGNDINNDGCDKISLTKCILTPSSPFKWSCNGDFGFRTNCFPLCGDGYRVSGTMNNNPYKEPCDDGNQLNNDGCDYIGPYTCSLSIPTSRWSCINNLLEQTQCLPICGDGIISKYPDGSLEPCDDGNDFNNDGCDKVSMTECRWSDQDQVNKRWICNDGIEGGITICRPICGDKVIVHDAKTGLLEPCDDGNGKSNDGCDQVSATQCQWTDYNQVIKRWDCSATVEGGFTVCKPICGDGIIVYDSATGFLEPCDDGNQINDDGCDYINQSQCQLTDFGQSKSRWQCSPSALYSKTICKPICGDGWIVKDTNGNFEPCDDGNQVSNDGCDYISIIECRNSTYPASNLWDCIQNLTSGREYFLPKCGDGYRVKGTSSNYRSTEEPCDDGNHLNNDGCDYTGPHGCKLSLPTSRWSCINNLLEQTHCLPICGDGIISKYPDGSLEPCDDGNDLDHDGCDKISMTECRLSDINHVKKRWNCNNASENGTTICYPICGDGIIVYNSNNQQLEPCDDGNMNDDDGCDYIDQYNCQLSDYGRINLRWQCNTPVLYDKTVCEPLCGDGVILKDVNGNIEPCDDGNIINNDGCDQISPTQCKLSDEGQITKRWDCNSPIVNTETLCYPICGDGIIVYNAINKTYEPCDDGNQINEDGCDYLDIHSCSLSMNSNRWKCNNPIGGKTYCESLCGDGYRVKNTQGIYEVCDDGNKMDYDGCDSSDPMLCKLSLPTSRWSCSIDPQTTQTTCIPVCGDGLISKGTDQVYEQCDDVSFMPNDGCDNSPDKRLCTIMPYWECWGVSMDNAVYDPLSLTSYCQPKCGNGVRTIKNDTYEGCDDGNGRSGDGCNDILKCYVENYWECWENQPLNRSYCQPICGDGHRIYLNSSYEQCDDGNTVSLDGCTSKCFIEPKYLCFNTSVDYSTNDYCTCQPYNVTAVFMKTWEVVILTYLYNLNTTLVDNTMTTTVKTVEAGDANPDACTILFPKSDIALFGLNYTCGIKDNVLKINFGLFPQIMNGTILHMNQGILKFQSCNEPAVLNLNIFVQYVPMIYPEYEIIYPDSIGLCNDISIYITKITGDGLRGWKNVTFYLVKTTPDQGKTALSTFNLYLQNRMNKNNTKITIPNSMLQTNVNYEFNVDVQNFQNLTTTQSFRLTKNINTPPYFNVTVNTDIFKIWSNLKFTAVADIPKCDGVNPVSNFTLYTKDDLVISWLQASGNEKLNIFPLGQSIKTTESTLSISSWTLQVGYSYSFILRCWPSQFPTLVSILSMQFTITPSPLIAYIDGGNRAVSSSKDLILNGSQSRDPDVRDASLDISNLIFDWKCYTTTQSDCVNFFGKTLKFTKEVVQVIEANTLSEGIYQFVLIVTKSSRSATYSVIIEVKLGDVPLVALLMPSALQEKPKINPDLSYVFTINVMSTNPDSLKYQWSITNLTNLASINPSYIITGLTRKTIRIAPWSFNQGLRYKFSVDVLNVNVTGTAYIELPVNTLPIDGYLIISPNTGKEWITTYMLSTAGWTDQDLPLKYQYSYYIIMPGDSSSSNGGVSNSEFMIKQFMLCEMDSVKDLNHVLPSGLSSVTSYQILITVYIEDNNGGTSNKSQIITVMPYNGWPDELSKIKELNATTNDLISKGQFSNKLPLISIITRLANDVKVEELVCNEESNRCLNNGACMNGKCNCVLDDTNNLFNGNLCQWNKTVQDGILSLNNAIIAELNKMVLIPTAYSQLSLLDKQCITEILENIISNTYLLTSDVYASLYTLMITLVDNIVSTLITVTNTSSSTSNGVDDTSGSSSAGSTSTNEGSSAATMMINDVTTTISNDCMVYHMSNIISKMVNYNDNLNSDESSSSSSLSTKKAEQQKLFQLLQDFSIIMMSNSVPNDTMSTFSNQLFSITGLKMTPDLMQNANIKFQDSQGSITLPSTGLIQNKIRTNLTQEVLNSEYQYNLVIVNWNNDPFEAYQSSLSSSGSSSSSTASTLSNILTINLQNTNDGSVINVSNLTEPIIMELPYQATSSSSASSSSSSIASTSALKCSWWDFQTLTWSNEGCEIDTSTNTTSTSSSSNTATTTTTTANGYVKCKCKHLTDFSVQSDVSSSLVNVIAKSNFGYLGNGPLNMNYGQVFTSSMFYILLFHMVFLATMTIWGKNKDIASQCLLHTIAKHKNVIKVNFNLPINNLIRRGRRSRKLRGANGFNNNGSDDKTKSAGIVSALCHAFWKSHLLLSIYNQYNVELSRPSRFLMFYFRNLLIITCQSLFNAGNITYTNLSESVVVIFLSTSIQVPIQLLFVKLYKDTKKSKTRLKNRLILNRANRNNQKWSKFQTVLRILVTLTIFIGSNYIIFIVLMTLNNDQINKWSLLYVTSFFTDMILNQSLKVIVNFLLIVYLGKSPENGYCIRSLLLMILDGKILQSLRQNTINMSSCLCIFLCLNLFFMSKMRILEIVFDLGMDYMIYMQ